MSKATCRMIEKPGSRAAICLQIIYEGKQFTSSPLGTRLYGIHGRSVFHFPRVLRDRYRHSVQENTLHFCFPTDNWREKMLPFCPARQWRRRKGMSVGFFFLLFTKFVTKVTGIKIMICQRLGQLVWKIWRHFKRRGSRGTTPEKPSSRFDIDGSYKRPLFLWGSV